MFRRRQHWHRQYSYQALLALVATGCWHWKPTTTIGHHIVPESGSQWECAMSNLIDVPLFKIAEPDVRKIDVPGRPGEDYPLDSGFMLHIWLKKRDWPYNGHTTSG